MALYNAIIVLLIKCVCLCNLLKSKII